MKMCRDNKESILAVLAAFVEDPVVLESQKTKMAQKQAQMTFDSRRHKFAAAEMQPAFKIIRRVEDKLGISSNHTPIIIKYKGRVSSRLNSTSTSEP